LTKHRKPGASSINIAYIVYNILIVKSRKIGRAGTDFRLMAADLIFLSGCGAARRGMNERREIRLCPGVLPDMEAVVKIRHGNINHKLAGPGK